MSRGSVQYQSVYGLKTVWVEDFDNFKHFLVGGLGQPSEKIYVAVTWDDDSQYFWENKKLMATKPPSSHNRPLEKKKR